MLAPNLNSPKISKLKEHFLFKQHYDIYQKILPLVKPSHYNKDDIILHYGDKANYFFIVLSGWIKLTKQTPDGNEVIIRLCAEDDVFGEVALLQRSEYPYSVQALANDTEILLIPAENIRIHIEKDKSFSATIMSILVENISQAELKFEHSKTMCATQRLGCFLLCLCHEQKIGSINLHIPVEKNILATYMGIKPETLSRSQQQLKQYGVAITGADVVIESIEKLKNFVCNSCSKFELTEIY